MEDKKKLTRQTGAPVPDNQNVQTAGPRGPMLMQDFWFLEKWPTSTEKLFRKEGCTPKVPAHLENLP